MQSWLSKLIPIYEETILSSSIKNCLCRYFYISTLETKSKCCTGSLFCHLQIIILVKPECKHSILYVFTHNINSTCSPTRIWSKNGCWPWYRQVETELIVSWIFKTNQRLHGPNSSLHHLRELFLTEIITHLFKLVFTDEIKWIELKRFSNLLG